LQNYKKFQYHQHALWKMFFFFPNGIFLSDVNEKFLFLRHHTGMFFVGGKWLFA